MRNSFFQLLKRFSGETRGNMAMMAAFTMIPMLCVAGAAVDYVYADNMRTKLAAAADAAAIAGGNMISASQGQRVNKARDVFFATIGQQAALRGVWFNGKDVTNGGNVTGFRVSVNAETETFFARIFGKDYVELGVNAEVTIGTPQYIEVALVLDVTGSMAGAKLDALKAAASNMIYTVTSRATFTDQVRFSIVPFSEYVNVGTGMAGKSWLRVPTPVTNTACWNPVISTSNCRTETATSYNDGVPFTYQYQACDVQYGPQQCSSYTVSWAGCVGYRNQPYDTQDGNYTTQIPGLLDVNCPAVITPLTSNVSILNSAISSLTPSGETYMPGGLIWGWRTLSPGEPYGETKKGTSADTGLKRFVVLMTDGVNTRSVNYPDPHAYGSNTNAANHLTSTICTNIKGTNGRGAPKDGEIAIFTIAFEVTDPTVNNLLRTCASQDSYYYSASGASQLTAAFAGIAAQLSALRLNK